jgi:hypothetical protein
MPLGYIEFHCDHLSQVLSHTHYPTFKEAAWVKLEKLSKVSEWLF